MNEKYGTINGEKIKLSKKDRKMLAKINFNLEGLAEEMKASEESSRSERLSLAEDPNLTADLHLALKEMFTDTGGYPEGTTLVKAQISQMLRPTINKLPHDATMIYLASGKDIYFPLALGGRKIAMVDDNLDGEKITDLVKTFNPKRKGKSLTIDFDFGKGKEKVTISLMRKPAQDYKPPSKIGVAFSYCGPPGLSLFTSPTLIKNLVMGGFIFDTSDEPLRNDDNLESYGLQVFGLMDNVWKNRIYRKISMDTTAIQKLLQHGK